MCEEDHYCRDGISYPATCSSPGFYCDNGSAVVKGCEVGYYCNYEHLSKNTNPLAGYVAGRNLCPTGFYSIGRHQAKCDPCHMPSNASRVATVWNVSATLQADNAALQAKAVAAKVIVASNYNSICVHPKFACSNYHALNASGSDCVPTCAFKASSNPGHIMQKCTDPTSITETPVSCGAQMECFAGKEKKCSKTSCVDGKPVR